MFQGLVPPTQFNSQGGMAGHNTLISARPPGGVLKWIPKGARIAASTLLQELLADIVSKTNDVEAWRRLLGFANGCFAKPDRGGKSRNLNGLIIKQISAYTAKLTPKT